MRGYPGGVEIDLALEKGEIHCRGTGITTHFAREPYFTWHKNGFDRHLVQTGNKKDPRLARRADVGRPHGQEENVLLSAAASPKSSLVSAHLGAPDDHHPGHRQIGSRSCATPI